MTNLYPKAINAFLTKKIDLVNDDIRVILVDRDDYTYAATHEFLSSIPAVARVAVTASLTGKTVGTIADGVFDADDTKFTAAAGDPSEAMVIYQHTGTDSTARLIDYIDGAGGTLPVIPNGGDLTVTWAAAGIFRING